MSEASQAPIVEIPLKDQLQGIKLNNTDLYSHMVNIFSKMMLDNQQMSFDNLEQYSYDIQKSGYNFKEHDKFVDQKANLIEQIQELEAIYTHTKSQLDPILEGEEDEKAPIGAIGQVQNFVKDASVLQEVSLGFGAEESLLIMKALTRLCYKKQATNIRLWGKIFCQNGFYYIAEGMSPNLEEPELDDENIDKQGDEEGINKNIYWVIQDLTQDWLPLPCVSADQIKISREIKYIFSGDLEKKIFYNPWFKGREKHLLKCVVTRISYSCEVGAKTRLDADENVVFPSFDELKSLNGWMHMSQNILKEGRLKHLIVEPENPPDDFDSDKFKLDIENADPFEIKNKTLDLDQPPASSKTAWTLKVLGDQQDYQANTFEPGNDNYGIILLKSQYWPGYYNVFQEKQNISIYIGYGFKNTQQLYFPKYPEIINQEQPLIEEEPEPNFPAEVPKNEEEEQQDEDENA